MSSPQNPPALPMANARPFAVPIKKPVEDEPRVSRPPVKGFNHHVNIRENSELSPKSTHVQLGADVYPIDNFPDISKLRILDENYASSQWDQVASHNTPARKRDSDQSFQTPRRFSLASNLTRSSSPTPGLSNTPFTPRSSFTAGSRGMPTTPYTPAFSYDSRRPSACSDVLGDYAEKSEKAVDWNMNAEIVGRYLLITNVPSDSSEFDFRDMIQNIAEFKALVIKHLRSKGCVIVAFFDPRENLKVYQRLRSGPISIGASYPQVELQCMPVSKDIVETVTGHGRAWEQIWKTSISTVRIEINGGLPMALDTMERVMAAIGSVQHLEAEGYDGRSFIVEFYDTRDAAQAIEALDRQTAGQALLHVEYYCPVNKESAPVRPSLGRQGFSLGSAAYIPGSLNVLRSNSASHIDILTASHPVDDIYSRRKSSPSSLGRFRADEDFFSSQSPSYSSSKRERNISSPISPCWNKEPSTYSDYEGTPSRILSLSRRLSEAGTVQGLVNRADITARAKQRQGLGGHWDVNDRKAIPEQNRVFPERITAGLDFRTTVMVKDVPNKLSRQELVDILNEVVPGDFDFVYLRFDFKNCCNVGYAFVNFCSVQSLLRFIEARVGKKWNMFSSEKVLQLSYADIQGKAALINKFKNSAVMGVIEPWRPQIFYTNGSLKGQPEPFPESDNLAIRQRSMSAQISSFAGTTKTLFDIERPYEYRATPYDHCF
ncbi:uncharacterized protein L203_100416 [Cryptococcus depauperatus CBS 7841]|uniref:Uncharacterized protein n=1 Tax=Cryptococcus depauperatus CBS 7841 TaxID=1295531 RepID=A0A1E3HYG6_9TREE|nr:hypothetical protein L203_05711 [Cryptococcus depauperatus CBS 7841]